MVHITIADTDPVDQYTASSGQTQFDITWPFFTDESIDVYLTPVGQDPDDASDILTLTTHYTVTGAGNQIVATKRITLVSAATTGDIITIRRNEPIARSSDLANQGGFSTETYNDEQDLVQMILQQHREEVGRALTGEITGGPFDALSRRIENLSPAVNSGDATNLASVIAEVNSQLAALVLSGSAGYVVAEPTIAPVGASLSAAINTWYAVTNESGGQFKSFPSTVTLPSGVSDGDWVRYTNRAPGNAGMPNFVPASGDFIAWPQRFSIATSGIAGGVLTINNAAWQAGDINLFGDIRGVYHDGAGWVTETANMTTAGTNTITTDASGNWNQAMDLRVGASDSGLISASFLSSFSDLLFIYDSSSQTWTMNVLASDDLLAESIGPTLGGTASFDEDFWFSGGASGSLSDMFQSLVTEIDARIEAGRVTDHTASFLCREQAYFQVRSWGGSSPATVQFSGSGNNQPFTVINIGTAILTLEPNASATTALIFCGSDGLVQQTASTGILVPPGAWVTVKRKQDRLGSVGDDLDVYAWGSEGVVLAGHTVPPITTIATGVATVTGEGRMIAVAAESATADDLDTITCVCTMGTVKYFKADAGDTITFKDGTGNISIGADIAVSGDEVLPLIWDGSNWCKFVVA